MSNGVAHIKFTRTEAAARHEQHTEIRQLCCPGTDGTKFRSKDWSQLEEGESQCQMGSHIQNSREPKPPRGRGSTPKFGDRAWTGLTERNFDQKPGSNWEKVNRNVKWGRTYKIHENRSHREAGAAHRNSVIGLGRD